MLQTKRMINLSVPTSYHQCTLQQLRAIASILLDLTQRASPLHPFNMFEYKLAVFIRLTNIEIVSPVNPRLPVEQQYYQIRFRTSRIRHLIDKLTGRNAPFSLYLYQIRYWLDKQKNPAGQRPGCLDWLDADSRSPFVVFPFEYIKRRHTGWRSVMAKTFKGPEPMLNGFSWHRFRFAQDLMENYVRQHNHLIAILNGPRPSQSELRKLRRSLDTAKASFLASIFERKLRYADEHGRIRRDWRYQSNQSFDNIEYFRNFPDVDWQIVLMWWSGIMRWLAATYPKVIKTQPAKKGKPVNPAEAYARTTATLEKYTGLDCDKLENEPFDVVLSHLQNLIDENDEIERINSKSHR